MRWLSEKQVFKIQHYVLYAIAFFIPLLPGAVPPLIISFGVLSVYNILMGYRRAQMKEVSILLLAFFGLQLIGLLYTNNMAKGWFSIQVQLSLLAFPISFIGFGMLNKFAYKTVLKAFLLGAIVAMVFCLGQSCYKVFVLDYKYFHFLGHRYSVILHQNYFALYLVFAQLILAYLEWPLFNPNRVWRSMSRVFIFLFLSMSILLTGSKIGFIMWSLALVGITIGLLGALKNKLIAVTFLMFMFGLMAVFISVNPFLQKRIMSVIHIAQGDTEVRPSANESTAVRSLVYNSAWELATSQPWYGQGTGDFQDALDAVYEEKSYVKAKERHYNAHNQFLQAWISVGIPGLMLMIGIFTVVFHRAITSREWLFLGFAVLALFISLTESIFNVQAGVVFFSFFAVLFSRRSASE
ncbi:MAG TPA: hypothetical protein DCX14_11380 [Flavobacteriales bacterium]|jgi:O-antigen ligase|nr:O-antigen ligase family protein [Salibacteraceae bacterium]HAW20776.1 hypothetical protein [Flavobacteriales bacterium]